MQDLTELLRSNPYPGRGIVVGKDVVYYWIMGRSANSRNRVFVPTEDGIRTEAHDPALLEDPSLIIYHPVRTMGGKLVVTNGDQTDTICQRRQLPRRAAWPANSSRTRPTSPRASPPSSTRTAPSRSPSSSTRTTAAASATSLPTRALTRAWATSSQHLSGRRQPAADLCRRADRGCASRRPGRRLGCPQRRQQGLDVREGRLRRPHLQQAPRRLRAGRESLT